MAVEGRYESEIIAAQVQALPIKLLATRILQTDSKCTRCKQLDESVDHNIPA